MNVYDLKKMFIVSVNIVVSIHIYIIYNNKLITLVI